MITLGKSVLDVLNTCRGKNLAKSISRLPGCVSLISELTCCGRGLVLHAMVADCRLQLCQTRKFVEIFLSFSERVALCVPTSNGLDFSVCLPAVK